jgi:sirohydrochlorin cobaltochelatase
MSKTILLVGHGGAPTDFPREKLRRLKQLEAQRMARGGGAMSAEEAELDALVRDWPRTQRTDPYKFGLEALAQALETRSAKTVRCAYNEFCGPSIERAVEDLAAEGASEILVATTMFTRGGVHSECEIPFAVQELRKKFPRVGIGYAWPFDLTMTADFMARHLEAAS